LSRPSPSPRERYLAGLTFGEPGHFLLRHSYGLMPGTLARWHREGLPPEVDEQGIWDHFGLYRPPPGLPINLDVFPAFQPMVLEETDEHVVSRDKRGTVRKLKKGVTTLALPIEFPISGWESWIEYKPRLQYAAERFQAGWLQRYEDLERAGQPVRVGWTGFYWMPRDLMGDEGLCLSYYTQPDLVHDILNTYADMLYASSERLLKRVRVDELSISEDMCYRNAMMISPATFREFMMPHYRRLLGLYGNHGTTLFTVDTDGNLDLITPLLMEAGVNAVVPCEVQAGNDIVAMRQRYGKRMAFIAGINKRALADQPISLVPGSVGPETPIEAIEEELAYRLPPVLRDGGYLAGLDHRVLPETSLASFTHYVRLAREYLGLDDDVSGLRG
jgi:hypothetical protein